MNKIESKTRRNIISFLFCVIIFQAMGGLMGWITQQDVESWYQTLNRSPLTPPDAAFGIVWSTLYFLLSIAFWLVWKLRESDDRKLALTLFAGHMLLNWAWTPVFFTLHATGVSLLMIFALIFTAAMTAWLFWPLDKRASIIFAPYIVWLIFAGHLTHYIWRHN